ncbi:hypothetical protein, partial [Proteus terrae]
DCSYLLFDDSKENFNFLFSENEIFTDKMIDNIIADNIDSFYQDDITNYFYNGIKSEELAFYLKNKPEINNFIDYCLKNRIRITVVGNSDKCFFNQDAIRQKNEVEKLHDIILENQFFNEKTIVFAKKEKLLSYQYGDFFIEGIAQRLNIPIYQVIDNRLSLSKDSVIVKPFIERKYIDKPLLANIALSDVITSVMEYNNIKPISFNEKIKEESKKLTKELYQFVSEKYPNYRNNKEFKLGYKKDIRTVIYDCSDKITVSD